MLLSSKRYWQTGFDYLRRTIKAFQSPMKYIWSPPRFSVHASLPRYSTTSLWSSAEASCTKFTACVKKLSSRLASSVRSSGLLKQAVMLDLTLMVKFSDTGMFWLEHAASTSADVGWCCLAPPRRGNLFHNRPKPQFSVYRKCTNLNNVRMTSFWFIHKVQCYIFKWQHDMFVFETEHLLSHSNKSIWKFEARP